MRAWVLVVWYVGIWAGPHDFPGGLQLESGPQCYERLAAISRGWQAWSRRQRLAPRPEFFVLDHVSGDLFVDMGPVWGVCRRRQDVDPATLRALDFGP